MSKHTVGPWRRGGLDKMYILDPNDNAICSVWSDHDDKEEDKANARLIAAAPDLLEALEDLYLECQLEGFQDTYDNMIKARAAIDKAKAIVRGTANGRV